MTMKVLYHKDFFPTQKLVVFQMPLSLSFQIDFKLFEIRTHSSVLDFCGFPKVPNLTRGI